MVKLLGDLALSAKGKTMQDFKSPPDQNIISELRMAIQEERKITLQILHLINEAQARRLFASAGFSTPFEWLTKEFGYSAAAAMRRLDSARALREIPSIEKKKEPANEWMF